MGGHQADVAEQDARRASWDDRRVLNGICWVLRSGAPRRDLPDCYDPKPGQILISPRVLMKVEYSVKVEPVGEFELKGIGRPLAAYNVLSAAP
jgi:hypothetical protein